ncbi:lysophospholipid acyltransferase family protein [Jannaschia sp. 2305UL9-9]|uniref:lysophospholipid acyltransferase family protein n=1 Tax=Jannaschia sp. 2305UL9-9 TaxID=3121638 RepID=UPI003528023F
MKHSIARDISYASSARTRRGKLLVRGLEALTGRHSLLLRAKGYDQAIGQGAIFWEEMAQRYGLQLEVLRGTLDMIPSTGPVVVVANHPYGILDGLILSLLLSRTRGADGFKVIANDVFLRAPDLANVILPVNFDETRAAQAINLQMRKTALAYLAGGGAVGVFPGGAVSTPARPFGPAKDPYWRGFSAKLIRQSGATVVPIHFEGANSRLFQLASHLHSTLRLGLFVREFRARTDGPVRLSVGTPISPQEIAAHPGNQSELMDWLRGRTYAAGGDDAELGFDWDTQKAGCT